MNAMHRFNIAEIRATSKSSSRMQVFKEVDVSLIGPLEKRTSMVLCSDEFLQLVAKEISLILDFYFVSYGSDRQPFLFLASFYQDTFFRTL